MMTNQMILVWFKDVHGEVDCKAKYKELAKKHHPDKHTNSEKNYKLAEEAFKSIGLEYDWLGKNGWNILVKEENHTYAKGGYTSNPFSGFNSRVTEDEPIWSNPFGNPRDNPFYKTRQSRRGTKPNEWNKEYGYNEEIFREYAKHLYTQQKLLVGLEFYTYQMILNKESYINGYNIFIRDYYKKQVKDKELEETIQLVNEASTNESIAKIKNRKDKQKAIVYAVVFNWLINNKNITLHDFERLTKAMGLGIENTARDLAYGWWIQFNNMI